MRYLPRGLAEAVTALALLAASPAAAEVAAAPTATVTYADLDLTSSTDARVMLQRIRLAAARVCAAVPLNDRVGDLSVERFQACRRQVTAEAVDRLDAAAVRAALAPAAPVLQARR